MIDKSSSRIDLAWGFGAQALQYGAMLLLLPILATRMSSSDIGLWFVFMSIQSLVLLFDIGLGNSLSRNFSYIFAGANRLLSKGVDIGNISPAVDPNLLAITIQTSRLLYTIVAIVVLALLASFGSLYISNLGGLATPGGKLAWVLFSAAVVLNIYFQWYLPLLIGSGRVRQNYKAIIIVRGGFAMLAASSLMIKPTLWGVSAAYLVAVFVMVIYARMELKDIISNASNEKINFPKLLNHFKLLWRNSYRMGLVSVGAFLISKYSVLLVASYYGLATSASYSITLQIFSAISAIALVPFNALLPRIAALRLAGSRDSLKQLLSIGYILTWCIALLGASTVLIFGNEVLLMIGSKTELVELPLLAMIAVTALLELNHGASAMVILSSNKVPFVPAAMLSGFVIMLLSSISAHFAFPLWTLVAIQMVTQMCYNNWRWPLDVVKEFEFNASDFYAGLVRLSRGRI